MFTFRQFSVDDSRSAMKVGTDGVVLGAWAPVDGVRRVLDIGCGCGLIALMIAQRAPQTEIYGVEVEAGAAADARRNFGRSPWSARLSLIEEDIFDFSAKTQERYDLIVCNPPFFTESLRSPEQTRSSARHEGELGVGTLISLASRLLVPSGGRLAFIAPTARDSEIDFMLASARLYPRRITRLRQRAARPVKRTLWEATREDGPSERGEIVISLDDGTNSPEYSSLTGQFYL